MNIKQVSGWVVVNQLIGLRANARELDALFDVLERDDPRQLVFTTLAQVTLDDVRLCLFGHIVCLILSVKVRSEGFNDDLFFRLKLLKPVTLLLSFILLAAGVVT